MPFTTEKERARIARRPATARRISYGRLPVKRSINMIAAAGKPVSWKKVFVMVIFIASLATVAGKFAVADRLTALYAVQQEVLSLQRQLDEGNEQIAACQAERVEERYAHYSWNGFETAELALPDYVQAMDLIEHVIMPYTSVDDWMISGNELTLNINGGTLQSVSRLVEQINADERVSHCDVNTAAMNSYTTSSENVLEEEMVTAKLVIYLQNAAREAFGE